MMNWAVAFNKRKMGNKRKGNKKKKFLDVAW